MRIAEVAFPVPVPKGFHYEVPSAMVVEAGCQVRAPFGPRRLVGTVLSVFDGVPQRPLKSLEAVLDLNPILPRELLETAIWMSHRYAAPIGECIRAALPSFVNPNVRSRSSAQLSPLNLSGNPETANGQSGSKPFELTSGQNQAIDVLTQQMQERRTSAALIYGVPASGKTEVYLRLIRKAISDGGQALFLLPEIALTQPFFNEFAASLDVPVVLWHSQLRIKEKREAWLGLKKGEVKVVVGARSASLLPFADLRLIVLDEEQDESFKQEGQSPYYHARDVSLHRAKDWRALVVLGSATPSLETWEMARKKEIALINMPQRVSKVSKPKVSVVPVPYGQCLSDELLKKIKERLARKEQSILLVNRRGFSTLIICFKCGWVDRCPSCGVAKIQHSLPEGGFVLQCHHCSGTGPMPGKCPKCGQASLRAAGAGTQKVVSELKRALPGVRVLRMDRDTLKEKDAQIYEQFKNGQADILVGTKLVAKSFHFPDVTLVGVIDADSMLHMPDFRSSERTMQLLAQVAGRSGRAGKEGEVVLQSLQPEHMAIAKTVEGNYGDFADAELAGRRSLGYPPYSILMRLVWSGKNGETVARAAQETAEALRSKLSAAGHEVVGPAPAVVRLVSGKPRYHLLIKVPDSANLERALSAVRSCETPSGIKRTINIDPYDLF